MKSLLLCAALAAASFPALAQTSITINLGQPDFYGRLDPGNYGPPQVVYAQPILVERQQRGNLQPVYLRVPPGHRKNWKKHCRKYGACGQPVMFVQDRWYSDVYAPRFRESHGRHERGNDRYYDRGHDKQRDKQHDKQHDKHHDKGNGKGHGKDH